MITLIHGTDITKSREYFIEQKKKYPEAAIFDGEKVTLTDLAQILEGGNLFANDAAVFIEQLISKKRASKEKEALVAYLLAQKDSAVFLWEGREVEKKALTQLKNQTVRIFDLPKSLFLFLDSLKPGNGKLLVKLFHESLAGGDAEMLIFMLVRQIRILLALSSASETQIDEVKRLAPWQLGKLQKQAKAFSVPELLALHQALFTIDRDQKTGKLPSSFISAIDFLLLEI